MDPIYLLTHHVLEPLQLAMRGSDLRRQARRYWTNQWASRDEIRAQQWASLQAMLRFAWDENRFYRARLDAAGARPEDIGSFEDFARLPLLSKEDLREHGAEMLSNGFNEERLLRKRTGGSTGVPVHLYWTGEATTTKAAIRMRHDRWAGYALGRKRAALWGDVKPVTGFKNHVEAALFTRTIYLDTLKMDERSLFEFARRIRRTRTRLLFGHGHSIYYFARFLKDHAVDDVRLDGIISTAEMLPPEERRVVEEVFGNVVFDRYGCEEVGLVATECPENHSMHTAAEGLYVEILGGSETEPGRVVVTDLLNRAVPVLRYEIGDLATVRDAPCPCGRGLPRIGPVVGRTSDVLYSPEGKRVSGISILDTVTIHIPGFRQVQVVQDAADHLTFNVVTGKGYCGESQQQLAAAVTRYFGPRMRHTVVLVNEIPLTGRGKFQFSISKLPASERERLERGDGARREQVN